jgi:hypothetical protein
MRWPQAATHDDGVCIFQCDGERFNNTVKVVPHFELQMRCNSHSRKLFTDVRRVGIDDLTEEQFGSDCYNIAPHAGIAAF